MGRKVKKKIFSSVLQNLPQSKFLHTEAYKVKENTHLFTLIQSFFAPFTTSQNIKQANKELYQCKAVYPSAVRHNWSDTVQLPAVPDISQERMGRACSLSFFVTLRPIAEIFIRLVEDHVLYNIRQRWKLQFC